LVPWSRTRLVGFLFRSLQGARFFDRNDSHWNRRQNAGPLEEDSTGCASIPIGEGRRLVRWKRGAQEAAVQRLSTRGGGQVLYRSGARGGAPIHPRPARSAVGAQIEQPARFAQIESVESLVEPLIDREDEIT
jgi:hypothetical protein